MRRRLHIVAVFLLAGAVVNVAVAVVGRTFEPLSIHRIGYPSPDKTQRLWSRCAPADWPDANIGLWSDAITWDDQVASHVPEPGYSQQPRISHSLVEVRAGWPFRSLVGSRVWCIEPADGQLISLRTLFWRYGFPAIPYGARWPGFAVNTLFYAAVLWLLIPGPFVLRRFIRMQCGRCVKCGYPMGESAVCTECGKALPGDRETAT